MINGDLSLAYNADYIPSDDVVIARYMGFAKFKMTVESGLWLSDANKFTDKYEGEIPVSFFEYLREEPGQFYDTLHKLMAKIYIPYITCWFEYEYEQDAMWRGYGVDPSDTMDNPAGVCILSTVGKLRRILEQEHIPYFKVTYIDVKNPPCIQPPVFFGEEDKHEMRATRVFHAIKQQQYDAEKEIRGITYRKLDKQGFGINTDWQELIDHIIVNPHTKPDRKEETIKYITERGLLNKIKESEIACNI